MQQRIGAGVGDLQTGGAMLTDEQILGLEPLGVAPRGDATALGLPAQNGSGAGVEDMGARGSAHGDADEILGSPDSRRREDPSYNGGESRDAGIGGEATGTAEPGWLKALDSSAIPNGAEAAAEARQWRQAAMDAAALDKDYFSVEPGARSALAARLHQNDPAAFRSMLADAARILAERDPQGLAELARELGVSNATVKSVAQAARRLPEPQRDSSADTNRRPQNDNVNTGGFPADAYRAFEAAANDDVARQVRDSIDRTLSATLPDGIADGARRRIGEDIFRDVSAALSTDRELSGKISELLRGWRFDTATRQQLAGLLTGRARNVLPEVARRVVSEWTSSMLASDRAKQARIESAVSRRDVTGGRLPEPVASGVRPGGRRFDYARTSDEQILEM